MTPANNSWKTAEVASTAEIRAAFPALERRHEGHAVAYFDGPGGTQVPRYVSEAMVDYLLNHNANTHWAFPTSAETDHALAHAREVLADFLNATPDEIVFGLNMTSLTLHISRAIGRMLFAGDAIVVTELDHHANIDPWWALEKERGIVIRQAKLIPETGQLDWEDLDRCLNQHRTKVLAIGAASNALGTINEISRAVAMAHEAGALAFVDAVHYAPHQLVDVHALGCDYLVYSAYKFHGPHVGVLFGRRDLLQTLDAPKLRPAPDHAPDRLETGTQNHEGIVGAAAAVEFLASLAGPVEPSGNDHAGGCRPRRERLQMVFDALEERGGALVAQLWEGLGSIEGIRLFGPPPTALRTPTISFVLDGIPSAEVSRRLADRGVFVSHGNFYAQTVARRLGQEAAGLVRVGCACYTSEAEIERVIEGVRAIAHAQA